MVSEFLLHTAEILFCHSARCASAAIIVCRDDDVFAAKNFLLNNFYVIIIIIILCVNITVFHLIIV
jgi:hypothetical protein